MATCRDQVEDKERQKVLQSIYEEVVVAVGPPEQLQQLQAVQELFGALLLQRPGVQWLQRVLQNTPQVPLPLFVPWGLYRVVVEPLGRRRR